MRILWVSNAEWSNTGYGNQTGLFVPRMRRAGHEIAQLPYYGFAGHKHKLDGHTYYGLNKGQWGDDAIGFTARDWKADIVITLMDVWVMDPTLLDRDGIRYCPWLPVDHEPAPRGIVDRLKSAYRPIAISQFGHRMLHDAGVWADYIPHGVDCRVFKPARTPKAKREAKQWLGFNPDGFLVTMVSANKGWPCRKAFPEAFDAFAQFSAQVPETEMYVHTIFDDRWGGPNLATLRATYGIPDNVVRFPTPEQFTLGFDDNMMRAVYQASDALLCPSYGEGFGIPIVEAQACGIPVIVNDCTSMSELAGPSFAVKPLAKWWTPLEAFQFLPSVNGLVEALRALHETWQSKREYKTLSAKCREFAMQYDADAVFDKFWKPWLDEVADEVQPFTIIPDIKRTTNQPVEVVQV